MVHCLLSVLRWSLCCCLFIVGVCLLCGKLSCGLVLVCCQFIVVTLLLFIHCGCVFIIPSGLVCCQFMEVTLLLFIHCGCVFIMWYIVYIVLGLVLVCCQFMVVTLLLFIHCWCVLIMWYIVCCQFMVVTLLLFSHCGCVFIMWYIVLRCGSCPVALSALSLWWSLCCCLLIVGVCLLCGTLSCSVVLGVHYLAAKEEIASCFTLITLWLSVFFLSSSRCRELVCSL